MGNAVTDFLFGGSQPTSTTTYGNTVTNTPAWYSDYTQGLIGKANAIAAEPYQIYGAPRIAEFTENQQAAFDMTPQAAGSYQPYLQSATQNITQNANSTIPQGIQQYMNPYQDAVTNRIGDLAQRQLSENIIPTIQNQFIGSGSFGGSRSGVALGKSMRDLQESTLAAQSSSLQQGYNAAAAQRQADLTRQLTASQQLGALGGLSQSLGLNQAAALEGIGTTQQAQDQRNLDLAYSDFANQRDYDRNQIAFLNSAIRGLEIPTSQTTVGQNTGTTYTPSGLAQLGQIGATIYGFGKMGSSTGSNR